MHLLRQLADALWVIDYPFQVMGLHLGARTSIVRLGSGGLWVHSPGPLDEQLIKEINALGSVQALVAPNAMHHLYLNQHVRTFSDARLYLSPALPSKLKDLSDYVVLAEETPELWRNDLQQHIVGGLPKIQEVVFFHSGSRTLFLTDLAFNIRNSPSWFTRLFMRLNGGYDRFGPTRLFRSFVKDRAALRGSLTYIQNWDFDRVIVTHGAVLEHGGRQALQESYAWV